MSLCEITPVEGPVSYMDIQLYSSQDIQGGLCPLYEKGFKITTLNNIWPPVVWVFPISNDVWWLIYCDSYGGSGFKSHPLNYVANKQVEAEVGEVIEYYEKAFGYDETMRKRLEEEASIRSITG